jgi:2-amino-4-hydroxy-6-hydroxymethyldihydropteridine diphosphokinase
VDRVAIALGSNLGDRAGHLDFAIARLAPLLSSLSVSRYFETVPLGVAGEQPLFLNAAAVGDTAITPNALLEELLAIELERGRIRPYPNAPRTLDLDLILYGSAIIDSAGLSLPHPRFRNRRFVLEPLASIAPQLRDPVSGKTVAELLAAL